MTSERTTTMDAGTLSYPRRLTEAVASTLVVCAVYFAAGNPAVPLQAPVAIPLDGAVPFRPESVWLYLPGYATAFLLTAWVIPEARRFRAALVAFGAMAVLALPFFLLLPIHGPRPAAPGDPGLTGEMVRWLFRTDPAVNTFPSLHVANATLCALLAARHHKGVGAVVWALAIGVFASVLLLKQHYVVDVPGGWVLAAVGYALWQAQASSPTLLGRLEALLGGAHHDATPHGAHGSARVSGPGSRGSRSPGPGGRSRGSGPPRSPRS